MWILLWSRDTGQWTLESGSCYNGTLMNFATVPAQFRNREERLQERPRDLEGTSK